MAYKRRLFYKELTFVYVDPPIPDTDQAIYAKKPIIVRRIPFLRYSRTSSFIYVDPSRNTNWSVQTPGSSSWSAQSAGEASWTNQAAGSATWSQETRATPGVVS